MPEPSRRTFFGHMAGITAAGSIIYGCTDLSAVASEVAAAYAAYQPYDDPSVTNAMTDAACDVWNDRHYDAVQRLADAKAQTLGELTLKMTTAMSWFEHADCEQNLGAAESDLLRSCLRDLRALA